MRGWIKLYRSVLDSDVFADPWHWQLFTWCLLKASHKSRTHNGQVINRGEFITGRKRGSKALGVSESRFYRGLKALEKRRCIVTKSNNQNTVVSVCKYDTYQRRNGTKRTAIEQQANSKRTTIEQRSNTDKNGKNERNKEPPPPTSPPMDTQRDGGWGEVGSILSTAGVSDWRAAIEAAKANGVKPAEVVALVDHFNENRSKFDPGALHHRILNHISGGDVGTGWPTPKAISPVGPKPFITPVKRAKPPPSPEEIAAAERLDALSTEECITLAAGALTPGSPGFKQYQKHGRSAPAIRPALIRALMTKMKAAG
ncbi:MAG: hypothetical protein WEB58_10950 [Planctomycetaceae bacterium]